LFKISLTVVVVVVEVVKVVDVMVVVVVDVIVETAAIVVWAVVEGFFVVEVVVVEVVVVVAEDVVEVNVVAGRVEIVVEGTSEVGIKVWVVRIVEDSVEADSVLTSTVVVSWLAPETFVSTEGNSSETGTLRN